MSGRKFLSNKTKKEKIVLTVTWLPMGNRFTRGFFKHGSIPTVGPVPKNSIHDIKTILKSGKYF